MIDLVKRTRIAPTPSGFIHLGNLASFVYTHALARVSNSTLMLRIDDLDQERFRASYVNDILDTLQFAGIHCHQEEFTQRERKSLYSSALAQLRNENKVYACKCSRTERTANLSHCACLQDHRSLDEPGVQWKLLPAAPPTIEMHDWTRGVLVYPFPEEMSALQVRKKDGDPSYHLASVVDDIHFGVTLIVRGEDLLASTLGQLHLAAVMGWEHFRSIQFVHHPLLLDTNQQKMSKSSGSASIQYMRAHGMSKEHVFAELSRHVGGSPSIATLEELEEELLRIWGS